MLLLQPVAEIDIRLGRCGRASSARRPRGPIARARWRPSAVNMMLVGVQPTPLFSRFSRWRVGKPLPRSCPRCPNSRTSSVVRNSSRTFWSLPPSSYCCAGRSAGGERLSRWNGRRRLSSVSMRRLAPSPSRSTTLAISSSTMARPATALSKAVGASTGQAITWTATRRDRRVPDDPSPG